MSTGENLRPRKKKQAPKAVLLRPHRDGQRWIAPPSILPKLAASVDNSLFQHKNIVIEFSISGTRVGLVDKNKPIVFDQSFDDVEHLNRARGLVQSTKKETLKSEFKEREISLTKQILKDLKPEVVKPTRKFEQEIAQFLKYLQNLDDSENELIKALPEDDIEKRFQDHGLKLIQLERTAIRQYLVQIVQGKEEKDFLQILQEHGVPSWFHKKAAEISLNNIKNNLKGLFFSINVSQTFFLTLNECVDENLLGFNKFLLERATVPIRLARMKDKLLNLSGKSSPSEEEKKRFGLSQVYIPPIGDLKRFLFAEKFPGKFPRTELLLLDAYNEAMTSIIYGTFQKQVPMKPFYSWATGIPEVEIPSETLNGSIKSQLSRRFKREKDKELSLEKNDFLLGIQKYIFEQISDSFRIKELFYPIVAAPDKKEETGYTVPDAKTLPVFDNQPLKGYLLPLKEEERKEIFQLKNLAFLIPKAEREQKSRSQGRGPIPKSSLSEKTKSFLRKLKDDPKFGKVISDKLVPYLKGFKDLGLQETAAEILYNSRDEPEIAEAPPPEAEAPLDDY